MKAVRFTTFLPPRLDAMTIVTTEEDLAVTIEDAISAELDTTREFFIVADEFEFTPRGSDAILTASMVGASRAAARQDAERNMAIMFYYDVGILPKVKQGGKLLATARAPFGAGDMEYVMRRIAAHPLFRGQSIEAPVDDGRLVTYAAGGEVKVHDLRTEPH